MGKGLDCFGLAIEVRNSIYPSLPSMPNYDWVYQKYDFNTLPPNLITSLFDKGPASSIKEEDLRDGDLIIFDGIRGAALGTFIDGSVLLFGARGVSVLVPTCSIDIISCWRLWGLALM